MKLCFATNNKHKVEEVKDALPPDITIVTLEEINCFDELPETSPTLEGNSLQKAQYVYSKYGVPCFADDTGLEVEALNGAPGVYSSRYAGDDRNSENNISLLLKNLHGAEDRSARFRTVFTLIGLEDEPLFFEGVINGSITTERRGSSGFGYDPVFLPAGHTRTFAEMTLHEKNTLSHRALATEKLVAFLSSREK